MASPTLAWVSSTVRMITRVSGTDLVIAWVALMPPRPGMRTSMMTTSGWVRSAILMASLMSGWSSATRMRTRALTCLPCPRCGSRPPGARRLGGGKPQPTRNGTTRTRGKEGPRRPAGPKPAGRSGGSGDTDPAARPAAHGAALLLGEAAPDASVLGGVEGPLQALLPDGAERADGLGRLDLRLGRPGRPNREEQLRIHIAAAGTMAPIH